jgi:uncharacterized membrane protein
MAEVTTVDRIWGVICYLDILVIIPLIFMRHNTFVKFHIKQGLVLLIIAIIFLLIPYVNYILLIIVSIFQIIGLVYAAMGRMQKLWLVGSLAEKFKF